MSPRAVVVDGEGWVTAAIHVEGPRPPQPNEHPVDEAMLDVVRECPVLRVLAGAMAVPSDDREAWKRLRQGGHSGAAAREIVRRLERIRPAMADAGGVTGEIPHGSLTPPGPVTFPEVAGLQLRPFGPADFDAVAPILSATGIYPATCPGPPECNCSPPEAHAWLELAARSAAGGWQFCLEFNGAPLQYEIIDQGAAAHQAIFSLTAHANRERPAWFWRETERPVFGLLRTAGKSVV